MYTSIAFSGPAGTGANTSGLLLAEFIASKGYSIRADKEYASIIKGDNNNFVVAISDQPQISLTKKLDLFFAFDQFAIDKNQSIYDLQQIIPLKDIKSPKKNMFALGAALAAVKISPEEIKSWLQSEHSNLDTPENLAEIAAGAKRFASSELAETCRTHTEQGTCLSLAQTIGAPKQLKLGNQLIAQGAVDAGLEFYSYYPMTPVSGIADSMMQYPQLTCFQGEDEIAVAMTMLGAKYAGKRAMCATSGGGFALMTESISFSHQAEIGGVYVLGMRDGPSTGTPTFSAQGDLAFAMNASFGETSPIVLAPSTFEEAYQMMMLALNWSDRYQHPTIVLVDKQLCEGYKSIDPHDLRQVPLDRGELLSHAQNTLPTDKESEEIQDTYLRYQITESGISPYAIPGEGLTWMTTSYQHDEAGATSESPEDKRQQMQKRFKKRTTFLAQEKLEHHAAYEIINPYAQKFFITRGINRYNLELLIKDKPDWGLIVIKIFHPFGQELADFFQDHFHQIQKLIFVEMNYEGQMEKVVRQEAQLQTPQRNEKITHFRKYALYPIFLEELQERMETR